MPDDRCPCCDGGGGTFAATENTLTWGGLLENSRESNFIFFDGGHFMLIDSTEKADERVLHALKDLVNGFVASLVEAIHESLSKTASSQQVRKMLATAATGSAVTEPETAAGADTHNTSSSSSTSSFAPPPPPLPPASPLPPLPPSYPPPIPPPSSPPPTPCHIVNIVDRVDNQCTKTLSGPPKA